MNTSLLVSFVTRLRRRFRWHLVGVFKIGTFFNNIAKHAAEEFGLEFADVVINTVWSGVLDLDAEADFEKRKSIFQISRSEKEAGAVIVALPTGVVAGFDEFGGSIFSESRESAVDDF